jgi:small subunit ribosomal protein S1
MAEAESSPRQGFSSQESDEDQEMLDLLTAAPPGFKSLRRGEVVEGIVVQVGRDEILVDIGTKAEAVIPLHETGAAAGELATIATFGESILAMVVETEGADGHAVLSLVRAQAERGWRNLQHSFEVGETVQGEVAEFNRGGLIVKVEGLRGFVPLSQIVDLRQASASDEPVEARLERLRGRVLDMKVIEINRRRNRLILSERAADQERRVRDRDRLIEELREGETRSGKVTSVCDFGAFVDVGGADGLIHLSELSWAPVGHPSQVVQVGDPVEVQVIAVDRERKKIALSLKRLQQEPWQTISERFHPGQVTQAKVTKLVTFGAFAEIEPGLEGLIHISELSDERIQHPRSVVHQGEVVTVKILRIEPERRRLGLSLRQALADADEGQARGMPMVYGDTDVDVENEWMGGARVVTSSAYEEPTPIPDSHEQVEETEVGNDEGSAQS